MTLLMLSLAALSGCASLSSTHGGKSSETLRQSAELLAKGQPEAALEVLEAAHRQRPNDVEIGIALHRQQAAYVRDMLSAADDALTQNNEAMASTYLEKARGMVPDNRRVQQAQAQLRRRMLLRADLAKAERLRVSAPKQALAIVKRVLAEQPDFQQAVQMRDALVREQLSQNGVRPNLSAALRKPVSLNFRSQPLENIFDAIARVTGINFVFDNDVQAGAPASLLATRTTAEDAINLLLRTNQLAKKVLDERTMLIYPARPDKGRAYREFMMRTFFLSNADAKSVMAALRQMVKPKDIYMNERINAIIMRDTPETIEVAERVVQALDIPQSEVTMDVQVLEVNTNDTVDLGMQYPGSVSVSPLGAQENLVTIGDLLNLNRDRLGVSGDSGGQLRMALRMLQKQGKTRTLANPKIRVRNNEKAGINVGERVPIVTTTTNNGVSTESVSYQDVGLILNVEPRISLDNEVTVKVSLEVSSILSQETTKNGLIAYKLGSRKAETLMTARDNETRVLAGLVKQYESTSSNGLPYLSTLPGIGHAFGAKEARNDRSEIVLLITPHVERSLDLPAANATTFLSGTETEMTTDSLRLRRDSRPAAADTPRGGEPDAAAKRSADASQTTPVRRDGPALHDPIASYETGSAASAPQQNEAKEANDTKDEVKAGDASQVKKTPQATPSSPTQQVTRARARRPVSA